MAFTGNENHAISLDDAGKLTENYRNGQTSPGILSHYFGKTALSGVLAQNGCVGVRIYYAQKENGDNTLVLVGANAAGNDLENGNILEFSLPCPPICPDIGVLNGTAQ